MKKSTVWMLGALLSATSLTAYAQGQITVGTGSVVDFGDAAVNFGCSSFTVSGTANLSSAHLSGVDALSSNGTLNNQNGNISVAGNFSAGNTLIGGAGTVQIVDGCSRAITQISGSPTFHSLSITTTSGKQVIFDSGQNTTVTGQLTLQGTSGNLLKVRSSVSGNPSLITATSQQTVQFVDVADNRAVGAQVAPGEPSLFQSISAGNVFRWFLFDEKGNPPKTPEPPDPPTSINPVPSLSVWALLTLAAIICIMNPGTLRSLSVHEKPKATSRRA